MKKILGAAVVAAMIAIPMTASAAPTVNAVQPQQVTAGVISPEYDQRYVTVYQYYSKLMYPDQFSVPYSYYYYQYPYSGYLYRGSVVDMGSQWWVTYSGYVTSYN